MLHDQPVIAIDMSATVRCFLSKTPPSLFAVIHVPAVERPRFLSQSKRSSQRFEAAEPPHKQSECLDAFGL